jgi:hypothetical protein
MSIVTVNTPKTSWIRDKGTVVSVTTDVLIDELGNKFIDEFNFNLLDSVSTDGVSESSDWLSIDKNATNWADAIANLSESMSRMTESGDIRVTALGESLDSIIISNNKTLPNSWTVTPENKTSWSNAFDIITEFNRIMADDNIRITLQGDFRISNTSDNKKNTTVWGEEY